nr:hypothetical protein Itr_chr02CG15600 [Ipomoea trifida]GLL40037.1 hypothetical protein Itr_chr11CG20180 [Ipomoea trifida]
MSILLTLLWRLAVARGGWRWRCVLRETEVRSAVAGDWRWLAVAGGGVASCERQRCGRRWLATGGSSRCGGVASCEGQRRRSAVGGGWRWRTFGGCGPGLAESAECGRLVGMAGG